MEVDLRFVENHSKDVGLVFKVRKVLYHSKSRYQDILVFESEGVGRVLVLDGCVMTTSVDEFIYHEMLAHVPLFSHPNPENVLVVGGGDGGTLREVFKHHRVKRGVLVEIDDQVVEVAKRFFPELACSFDDPRCSLEFCDGVEYLKNVKEKFQVILVDSTDPVGPAENLFSLEFFQSVYNALSEDGIFVTQCETPFYFRDFIKDVISHLKSIFPKVALYTAYVPFYPSGMWCFAAASKGPDPREPIFDGSLDTRYYNREVHRASFALPNFLKELC